MMAVLSYISTLFLGVLILLFPLMCITIAILTFGAIGSFLLYLINGYKLAKQKRS